VVAAAEAALPSWLYVLGTAVAVLGALWGWRNRRAVAAFFRSGSIGSVATVAADVIETFEARIGQLEAENSRIVAENGRLRDEVRQLRELVTQSARVDDLHKLVTTHHSEVMAALKARPA
jgi:uncharacterized protein (UPF0335 family)